MFNDSVAQWMSTPPIVTSPTTSLATAQRVMELHQVRRLPVVQQNELIGIVTLSNLWEAQPSATTTLSAFELHALAGSVTVAECMTRNPLTIRPEMSILRAAQLMLEHKVGGLPVVENRRVVGMITESDLFRLIIANVASIDIAPSHIPTIVCRHCGTALSHKPVLEINADMVCWNCHYHVRRCDNCRFFDGIACILNSNDYFTPIPGQHCSEFIYLPLQAVSAGGS